VGFLRLARSALAFEGGEISSAGSSDGFRAIFRLGLPKLIGAGGGDAMRSSKSVKLPLPVPAPAGALDELEAACGGWTCSKGLRVTFVVVASNVVLLSISASE
jgi:hypothetical protein